MSRFLIAAALILTLAVSSRAQQKSIRVNCGGSAYTDSKGQIWQADTGFNLGTTTSTSMKVAGTPDPSLFQTGRINTTNSPLIYSFSVAAGNYHVNLYFAETIQH